MNIDENCELWALRQRIRLGKDLMLRSGVFSEVSRQMTRARGEGL